MQAIVYHSSKVQGLEVISPRISTHNKPWVYATKDIATSALFLGDNFDFICQIGGDEKGIYVFERFQGAFKLAYGNKKGSIYSLDSSNFRENQTDWSAELVSERAENVLEESYIENVEDYIMSLVDEKKISLYLYPNLPEGVPKDKSDIVERGINWTMQFGENTLERVLEYHPDVLERVLRGLVNKGYEFKSDRWRTQSLINNVDRVT